MKTKKESYFSWALKKEDWGIREAFDAGFEAGRQSVIDEWAENKKTLLECFSYIPPFHLSDGAGVYGIPLKKA